MSVQNPLLGVGFGLSRRGRGGGGGEVEWKEGERREGGLPMCKTNWPCYWGDHDTVTFNLKTKGSN